jgi:hypothetical protein
MADEKVTIKLEVNADTRGARQVSRDLKKIAAQASAINTASGLRSSTRILQNSLDAQGQKWRKHFDEVDKLVKGFGKMLTVSMKLMTKGVIAEFALLALSMVGVHAAFAAGQGIMKAYKWAMEATGAAASAMAIAITTAAAAIREQQAAMFAYKGTGMKEFGSGLNQTRVLMRGLTMDSQMAFIGVENLNKAFAAVSKTSTFTASSQGLLKGLMDFAAAGQPIEQGVEKAGELVAVLQNTKASWAEIKKSAEASSPAMKKALEEAEKSGIKTRESLIDAIKSGKLSELGGVVGQFDAVSGTLINRIKQNFNMLRGQFADAGQGFLKPVKESLDEVFKIFRRAFTRTIPAMSGKGLSSLTDGIISIAEKLEELYVKVIYSYASRTEGLFENISKWWNKFRSGWNDIANALRPLIDGARVIEEAFMAAMQPIKDVVSDKFGSFNEWVQENRSDVVEFGDRVGKLIASIMTAIGKLGDMYKTLLPFINRLITGLTQVTDLLGKMFGMFGDMGEFGSMFALLGLRQVKTRASAFAGGQLRIEGGDEGRDSGGLTPAQRRLIDNEPYGRNFDDDGLRSRTGGQVNPFPTGGLRNSTEDLMDSIDAENAAERDAAATSTRRGRARRRLRDRGDGIFGRFMGFDAIEAEARGEAPPERRRGRIGTYFADQMKNFSEPMTAKEIKEIEKNSKRPGMIGRSGVAQALRRQRARNIKLDRFQKSGGAQMGVGMGLGMLSSVVPEEMQGALALGGMAAQINPLLGLGVAGIGGAFSAQSAGMGALAGMGGGAAIGAMVGGPVGAIVGAALGGVAGAISGWRNKSKKQAEEARKAVQDTLNASTAGIVSNVAKNLASQGGQLGAMPIKQGLAQVGSQASSTLAGMNKARNELISSLGADAYGSGGQLTVAAEREANKASLDAFLNSFAARGEVLDKDALKKIRNNPAEAREEAEKKLNAQTEASTFMLDMFGKRMGELTNLTGMSESQVLALSKSLGVDLMDPLKGTIELTKELGYLQLRTAEEITQAYATLAGDVQTVFSQAIDALNAPDVVNEATRTISDLIDSGSAKDTDILAYLENVVGQTVSYYGDNTAGAITQLLTSFGTEDTMGTAFTDPNSPLYGRQAAFETAEVGAALSKTTDMMIDRMSSELLRDTNANLTSSSGQVIENGAAFMAQIGNIARSNPALLSTFQEAAGNNFEAFGGDAAEFFRNQGIDIQSLGVTEAASAAPSQEGLDDAVKDEITELSKQFGSIFEKYSDKPEWMTDKFIRKIAEEGDTSTPRGSGIGDTTSSRLATTMNRHSVMDSMLTGKRNITSAWRNTNLGSMNSDHVTGRAYDLTGQNLGQYQSLVNGNGGFAEFHGVNGARHLHVVPGPVGDTAVPSMSPSTPARSTSSSGVTNNYSVNVSTNASDPEAVATFVMQKIEQVNRDSRERR